MFIYQINFNPDDYFYFPINSFIWPILFNTSASELLVPEGTIRIVVGASALPWFIRYVHYWNVQFPNHVIIIKAKVILPRA
jgi:hypothetical protein